jgi:hypothetical protein
MNAIATTEPVSAETLEHVIGTGDLSKLTTQQRVEYYRRTCETIGVNPLTRPFRFLSLNGSLMLYATRDLTDQLRQVHKVKIAIVDKAMDGDLFIVTARATMPDGRQDEDVGAVTIGRLQGDARANAVMKAMTKAKRRVTLSICGLGFTDESEIETIRGDVQTFDAEAEPFAPVRAAAAPTPQSPRKVEHDKPQTRTDAQWQVWLDKLRAAVAVLYSRAEVVEIGGRGTVAEAAATGPDFVKREVAAILSEAYGRFPDDDTEALPEDEPADEPVV